MHGPAPKNWEPVARDVDHVDVTGFGGDALLQNASAFIDQGEDQALDDFFIGDFSKGQAMLRAMVVQELLHQGGMHRISFSACVIVPTGASFLPKATQVADQVNHGAVLHVRCFLVAPFSDGPPNVVARQVAHLERSHGKPEAFNGLIDLFGRAALFKQKTSLPGVLLDHSVADETIANAGDHSDFFDFFGDRHHRGQDFLGRFSGAHHLKQFHHVGRREEMHSHDVCRALGERSDGVDVQGGGVGCQNGTRFCTRIQGFEDVFFDLHVFKNRFDDQVARRQVLKLQRAAQVLEHGLKLVRL